jgi:hypothetical protein
LETVKWIFAIDPFTMPTLISIDIAVQAGHDNVMQLLRGKGITTHFVKYYLFDGTGRNSVYYCSTYARRDPTNMRRMGKVARERWAARLYPSDCRSPFSMNDMVIRVLCHNMIALG